MAIRVFYHCLLLNEWKSVIGEQFGKLLSYGLYDAASEVCIGVAGDWRDIDLLKASLGGYSKCVVHPAGNDYEYVTLRLVEECVRDNPGDTFCYFHTKSISRAGANQNWRRFLDLYTITHWKACIKALEIYEVVVPIWYAYREAATTEEMPCRLRQGGTRDFQDERVIGFPSGNYWWARGEYLSCLPSLASMDTGNRYNAELWVGMGSGRVYPLQGVATGIELWEGRFNESEISLYQYDQQYRAVVI